MSIRARLRVAALDQINEMVEQLEARALEICGDTPIEPRELCRLVSSNRSSTLTSKLQSKLADKAEQQIIADLTPAEPEQY